MGFFFSLRVKTLTCKISTLFLCFIRPWQSHQTINTFYQELTHFFSSIRPWSDGLFVQFKGENTDLYHPNSISMLHQTMATPSDHQHISPRVDSFFGSGPEGADDLCKVAEKWAKLEQVKQSSDNRCVLVDCLRSLNRLLNGILSCS